MHIYHKHLELAIREAIETYLNTRRQQKELGCRWLRRNDIFIIGDDDINDPDDRRHGRDYRLDKILEGKEVALKEIKEQINRLYNERMIEYLKEKHGTLHFIHGEHYLVCTLKNGGVAVVDYGYLDTKPRKAAAIYLHIKKSLGEKDDLESSYIHPLIETKITDIADFIIKCYNYTDRLHF